MDSDNRMAADHGTGNVSASQTLIPDGWYLITSGDLRGGDKVWSSASLAWLPVTTNSNYRAEQFPAAIRHSR